MLPLSKPTFARAIPPTIPRFPLHIPSLREFLDSYEDLLLSSTPNRCPKNTISPEQRKEIAEFFNDNTLLSKKDAAIIQHLITAFRLGSYPRDRALTLNNINIILENSEDIEFPENIVLLDCTLGSPGKIRFYQGSVTATVEHADVTGLGPKATAIAAEWLSSATAVSGATAIARGSRTRACAYGNGSRARAEGERSSAYAARGAIAYGKGPLSETFASGQGSEAYAAGFNGKTEASKGAICYVVAQGKIGSAKDPDSKVWGLGQGSTLLAEDGAMAIGVGANTRITVRNHSQGIARGINSIVMAKIASTAIAEGKKTNAYALDSSSTAQATVPDAGAYFSDRGEGTVFQALGEITLPGTK